MRACLYPSKLAGQVQAPPSKSMAHRALICAGLAHGESRIEGILPSEDMEATIRGLEALGARVHLADTTACIVGCGGRILPGGGPVDCGESGSTLRFLLPLFGLSGRSSRLFGRGRLPRRPLGPYQAVFSAQGLSFSQDETGVSFGGPLRPGIFHVPGDVSSQFLSGLLFALPLLSGDSEIRISPPFESRSYVALTLDVLHAFGISVSFSDALTLTVPGGQRYAPCSSYRVEGDDSQAAFFMLPGAVLGGVSVAGLRQDSKQGDRAMQHILARCGVATARIAGVYMPVQGALHATQIDLADCPDLGPVLMALGLFCEGETVIRHAGRLRLKESDRIAAMEAELSKLGGRIRSEADTVYVRGSALHEGPPLCTHGDHRIAMALAMTVLCAGLHGEIEGAEAVNKSYPGFWQDLAGLGAQLSFLT
ncbi:MAG: 3-phosphoshikimate 1-carboxyvinyltransferase [Clostridia bacterium]|nr:3-phosphoshikimate 1-carboxyvinyltransferase [Clostridia bacterium]